ncbi:hypothetical protein GCM10009133_11800 [Cocleimonas flava]|uniref:Spore coat protein U-like protein n=1 Tax=Cocleimonas flava TaxID=634765 RepID=A0A4V2P8Y5_9GAMM|nr:hypothetical protein [Cocleimonas flava]TCJ87545.1 hypothetical protein EV695_2056 [Cocleimonas flava]
MKKRSLILSVSLLLLSSAFSLKAAQDSAEINISTSVDEYLNFIGSAAGASKYFTADEIQPTGSSTSGPRLSLGTLGLESNHPGDCDIAFSAKNNFRLRHTVSNERLTHFRLLWKGEGMSGNPLRTNKLTLPCNSSLSTINFQAVAYFNPNPQAGVYQDIVTVTVTTQ